MNKCLKNIENGISHFTLCLKCENPGEALCEPRESTEKNAINIYVPQKGRDALALE